MAWDGKVTNVGLSLLEQWGTGTQTLHIDKATIGTGTVPSASLIASTTVAGEIGETPITGSSVVTGGIQYQVQVQPQTAAYTLHQIGVWGHLGDSGTATLIAVFQEEDGINIPAEADEPGYALTVYCTVAMSNTGSITINLSGGAYATLDMMNAALALKAPIASPALTGTPTAPTAAAGTNTTQIATTAFVQTGLAGKQNTLTFDTTPTSGSANPVTSGGVYEKLGAVGNTPLQTQVTELSNKQQIAMYRSLGQIGIASSTASTTDIYTAMPSPSILLITNSELTDPPPTYGYLYYTIEFIRKSNNRGRIIAYSKSDNKMFDMALDSNNNPTGVWVPRCDASLFVIVATGDTAPQAITAGYFVEWRSALYVAKSNIANGATLSTSNLTVVSGGGLNALMQDIKSNFLTHRKTPGTYTDQGVTGAYGYITTGGTKAVVYIPMVWNIDVQSVTVSKFLSRIRTVSGTYLGGSNNADLSSYITSASISKAQGMIVVALDNSNGWGITNNTPMIGEATISYIASNT